MVGVDVDETGEDVAIQTRVSEFTFVVQVTTGALEVPTAIPMFEITGAEVVAVVVAGAAMT